MRCTRTDIKVQSLLATFLSLFLIFSEVSVSHVLLLSFVASSLGFSSHGSESIRWHVAGQSLGFGFAFSRGQLQVNAKLSDSVPVWQVLHPAGDVAVPDELLHEVSGVPCGSSILLANGSNAAIGSVIAGQKVLAFDDKRQKMTYATVIDSWKECGIPSSSLASVQLSASGAGNTLNSAMGFNATIVLGKDHPLYCKRTLTDQSHKESEYHWRSFQGCSRSADATVTVTGCLLWTLDCNGSTYSQSTDLLAVPTRTCAHTVSPAPSASALVSVSVSSDNDSDSDSGCLCNMEVARVHNYFLELHTTSRNRLAALVHNGKNKKSNEGNSVTASQEPLVRGTGASSAAARTLSPAGERVSIRLESRGITIQDSHGEEFKRPDAQFHFSVTEKDAKMLRGMFSQQGEVSSVASASSASAAKSKKAPSKLRPGSVEVKDGVVVFDETASKEISTFFRNPKNQDQIEDKLLTKEVSETIHAHEDFVRHLAKGLKEAEEISNNWDPYRDWQLDGPSMSELAKGKPFGITSTATLVFNKLGTLIPVYVQISAHAGDVAKVNEEGRQAVYENYKKFVELRDPFQAIGVARDATAPIVAVPIESRHLALFKKDGAQESSVGRMLARRDANLPSMNEAVLKADQKLARPEPNLDTMKRRMEYRKFFTTLHAEVQTAMVADFFGFSIRKQGTSDDACRGCNVAQLQPEWYPISHKESFLSQADSAEHLQETMIRADGSFVDFSKREVEVKEKGQTKMEKGADGKLKPVMRWETDAEVLDRLNKEEAVAVRGGYCTNGCSKHKHAASTGGSSASSSASSTGTSSTSSLQLKNDRGMYYAAPEDVAELLHRYENYYQDQQKKPLSDPTRGDRGPDSWAYNRLAFSEANLYAVVLPGYKETGVPEFEVLTKELRQDDAVMNSVEAVSDAKYKESEITRAISERVVNILLEYYPPTEVGQALVDAGLYARETALGRPTTDDQRIAHFVVTKFLNTDEVLGNLHKNLDKQRMLTTVEQWQMRLIFNTAVSAQLKLAEDTKNVAGTYSAEKVQFLRSLSHMVSQDSHYEAINVAERDLSALQNLPTFAVYNKFPLEQVARRAAELKNAALDRKQEFTKGAIAKEQYEIEKAKREMEEKEKAAKEAAEKKEPEERKKNDSHGDKTSQKKDKQQRSGGKLSATSANAEPQVKSSSSASAAASAAAAQPPHSTATATSTGSGANAASTGTGRTAALLATAQQAYQSDKIRKEQSAAAAAAAAQTAPATTQTAAVPAAVSAANTESDKQPSSEQSDTDK